MQPNSTGRRKSPRPNKPLSSPGANRFQQGAKLLLLPLERDLECKWLSEDGQHVGLKHSEA